MTAKPTRRQRERLRHKNEILDAAERAFSRKGFHSSSIADIAKEAEFAVGTLYKFFKSKEEMYQNLFLRKINTIRARVESETASLKDPRRKIEKVIDTNLYFAKEYREFFLLHMTEVLGVLKPVPLASPRIQQRYQGFIKFLSGIIKSGQRKRLFRALNPAYAAISLIGVMHNCAALWISGGGSLSIEEVADMAKKIFFGGMLESK